DLPEVGLLCVLDADREGYLRSHRSLIQMVGRAARNVNGRVIFYADQITQSMQTAMDETNRRRRLQQEYNRRHNITPTTIVSQIDDVLASIFEADYVTVDKEEETVTHYHYPGQGPKRGHKEGPVRNAATRKAMAAADKAGLGR